MSSVHNTRVVILLFICFELIADYYFARMNIYKCGFIRIPQFYDYLTLSVAPLSTMKEFVINVLSASNVIIDPCSNNLVLRLEIKQKTQQD